MKTTTLLSSWENPQDVSRANLLFENRNKSYGGYYIRVYYPERIFRAFIFAVFGFGVFMTGIFLAGKYFDNPGITIPPNIPIWFDPPVGTPLSPRPPNNPPTRSGREKPLQGFATTVVVDSIIEADTSAADVPATNLNPGNTTAGGDSASDENTSDNTGKINPNVIVKVPEIFPEFPGGDKKLFEFLRDNIDYPAQARENKTQGYVYITFVVDKRGKISDVKLLRGIGDGCEEEAISAIRKMPDWIPGRMGGEPVDVQYNLPVNFKLK